MQHNTYINIVKFQNKNITNNFNKFFIPMELRILEVKRRVFQVSDQDNRFQALSDGEEHHVIDTYTRAIACQPTCARLASLHLKRCVATLVHKCWIRYEIWSNNFKKIQENNKNNKIYFNCWIMKIKNYIFIFSWILTSKFEWTKKYIIIWNKKIKKDVFKSRYYTIESVMILLLLISLHHQRSMEHNP